MDVLERLFELALVCTQFRGDRPAYTNLLTRILPPLMPCRCIYAGAIGTAGSGDIHAHVLDSVFKRVLLLEANWTSADCSDVFGSGWQLNVHRSPNGGLRPRRSEPGHVVLCSHVNADHIGSDSTCPQSRFAFLASSDPDTLKDTCKYLHVVLPHLDEALRRVNTRVPAPIPELTAAERGVAYWLFRGKTNKEIARILQKSDATVRNQLHSIFSKLKVRHRVEAIRELSRMKDATSVSSGTMRSLQNERYSLT